MSYQSSEYLVENWNQEQLDLELSAPHQAVGDAVICVDRDGILVLWNPGAERLFGFSSQEAIGEPLDLIIPHAYRKPHWEGFHAAMRQNQTRLGTKVIRVPMLRKDKSQFRGALTVGIVRGENNRIERIGAMIREETENKGTQE
ncbi:PAS domain-containing protein [Gimesia algae]|uniref:Sensor protein FixL n=1 Tax=Gimesia algae TaxID=2527971 RepID=A0A517VHP7_9PLAN|nr:PAS domain-containing protein [Gimesia algae]QDT92488.1 Sensor protein FixL [Gimesia algae]